ncbi:MAG TPA: hypothetical protein DD381_05420 [Lentisphaeria bacterium]|nr:MAG: hypothetical protein A2X47_10790 [Lentisphaerae bacterium GWF2_38_69]HBM15770.1 hypothetical protein [Lentisphaeria bacterium]
MDKEVLTTGKSILDKEDYIPGNRKTKWGIMSKIPILDLDGKIEGLLGFFVDITDRKKAEEELYSYQVQLKKQNEELHIHQAELETQNEELRQAHAELDSVRKRYFDLYDLAPVSFFTINQKGIITETNLSSSIMFGIDRDKLINQPFAKLIFPEERDIFYLRNKEVFETGKQLSWDMRMLHTDGSPFWVYLQAKPLQNIESIIALINISAYKKFEK